MSLIRSCLTEFWSAFQKLYDSLLTGIAGKVERLTFADEELSEECPALYLAQILKEKLNESAAQDFAKMSER